MPFRIAHRYLASIRYASMPDHPGFLLRSVNKGMLFQVDPFSDEAAQAFLRSEVCYSLFANFCFYKRIDAECGIGS
jgi:hypothetical protein